MNSVLNHMLSVSDQFNCASTQSIFSGLGSNQRKIAIISSIAIAILSIYVLFKCYFDQSNGSIHFLSHFGSQSKNSSSVKDTSKSTTTSQPMHKVSKGTSTVKASSGIGSKNSTKTQTDGKATSVIQQTPVSKIATPIIKSSHSGSSSISSARVDVPTAQEKIDSLVKRKLKPLKTQDNSYNCLDEQLQIIEILDEEMQRKHTDIPFKDLEAHLKTTLNKYPRVLYQYFLQQSTKNPKTDLQKGWIAEQLAIFSSLMDQYSSYQDFIDSSLDWMNEILKLFFNNGAIRNDKKNDLIVFKELFSVMRKFSPSNKSLADSIKLKLTKIDNFNSLNQSTISKSKLTGRSTSATLPKNATSSDIEKYINSELVFTTQGPDSYKKLTDAFHTIEILNEALQDINLDSITKINIQRKLYDVLMGYPKKYIDYISNSGSHRRWYYNHEQTVILSGLLDEYVHHNQFIYETFNRINQFLNNQYFLNQSVVDETKKHDLIVFNEYFEMLNKHYQTLQKSDQNLAFDLKIKLANLPLSDDIDRSSFSNIFLTEAEQVQILTKHFQAKEDLGINEVIKDFDQAIGIAPDDLSKLCKCLSDHSHLSLQNRDKLRQAVERKFHLRFSDFSNRKLQSTLVFKVVHHQFGVSNSNINDLHMAAKAKHYFSQQIGLKEDEIRIPRWYHTTQISSVEKIIKTSIDCKRKQQDFRGAWVSSHRESFGNGEASLAFSHHITKIEPDVFIGYENPSFRRGVRWRGLQKQDIPMANPQHNQPYLVIISLRADALFISYKRKNKNELAAKKIGHVKFMTNEQLQFIQQEYFSLFGNPNLTSGWWGKQDEKAIGKHTFAHSLL